MTSKDNNFTNFFAQNNIGNFFESYNKSPIDMKSFLETQRKNFQALSEVQQKTFEGIQEIAQRQSAILSQIVEDNSEIAKQALTEGTPEEKIAQNAEIFKKTYERNIDGFQEISDLVAKSNQQASGILNKRVSASVNELKSAIKKPNGKAA
ncbi:MAG: phasin family protein [Bdellovibrionales bacterium]